jgi:hypothetical protein
MEKITFATNKPQALALQFLEPKLVPSNFGGNQAMFSTTDSRVFFVSEAVGNIIAGQLRDLAVQKGMPVEICKCEVDAGKGRKTIRWTVLQIRPAVGGQPDGTFAVPAAAPAARTELERKLRESVERAKAEAGAGTPAPATASSQQPLASNRPNGSSKVNGVNGHAAMPEIATGWAPPLLQQANSLIDVYAAALTYSGKYGAAVKPDDVRSIVLSCFINVMKGGNGNGSHS